MPLLLLWSHPQLKLNSLYLETSVTLYKRLNMSFAALRADTFRFHSLLVGFIS